MYDPCAYEDGTELIRRADALGLHTLDNQGTPAGVYTWCLFDPAAPDILLQRYPTRSWGLPERGCPFYVRSREERQLLDRLATVQ